MTYETGLLKLGINVTADEGRGDRVSESLHFISLMFVSLGNYLSFYRSGLLRRPPEDRQPER